MISKTKLTFFTKILSIAQIFKCTLNFSNQISAIHVTNIYFLYFTSNNNFSCAFDHCSFEYLNENIKMQQANMWEQSQKWKFHHYKGKGLAPIVPQGYAICYKTFLTFGYDDKNQTFWLHVPAYKLLCILFIVKNINRLLLSDTILPPQIR